MTSMTCFFVCLMISSLLRIIFIREGSPLTVKDWTIFSIFFYSAFRCMAILLNVRMDVTRDICFNSHFRVAVPFLPFAKQSIVKLSLPLLSGFRSVQCPTVQHVQSSEKQWTDYYTKIINDLFISFSTNQ